MTLRKVPTDAANVPSRAGTRTALEEAQVARESRLYRRILSEKIKR